MADAMYNNHREEAMKGLRALNTEVIKGTGVTSAYTYNAAHTSINDVPGANRVHTSGALANKTTTNGIFDADDTTFTARMREAGVQVHLGLLAGEAMRLNEVYCRHVTSGLPHVTLKIGMSLDGKTATRSGDARWITGEESRRRVHELRNVTDAVLVGIGTILADDPDLTCRLPGAACRHPDRVVIDSHLRIPSKARVLAHRNKGRTILVAGPHAPEARVRELRELGAEVVVVDGAERRVEPAAVMARLAGMGITSVLIEGGSEIAASCLEAGVVDKLVFFIAPLIIGGREAPPVIGGRGAGPLAEALWLRDLRWSASGEDLMVEAQLRGAGCSRA